MSEGEAVAVKDFASAKKSRKKFRPSKVHILIAVAVVALFSVTLFGCILPNYASAAEYEEQTSQLKNEMAALDAESEKISDSLSDKEALFEKIAREEYGYCKPGEKVFYSSSFGE